MAFAVMKRRKLVTALNLLGISFTLAFMTVIYGLYDLKYGAVYPLKNTDKMAFYDGIPLKLEHERGSFNTSINRDYKTYKQLQTELESIEYSSFQFFSNREFGFFHEGKYMTLSHAYVDEGYWNIMDFKLTDGQLFKKEDVGNRNKVAVINAYTASTLFSDKKNAIGKTILVQKEAYKVIGVVEDVGMKSSAFADVWLPITTIKRFNDNYSGKITYYLKDNKTHGDLKAELLRWYNKNKDEILAQLKFSKQYKRVPSEGEINLKTFGESASGYLQDAKQLLSMRTNETYFYDIPSENAVTPEEGLKELKRLKVILIILAFLFLMIPVINMINLNSSQIGDRASEIGIRKAFGANTKHLVRQFLVENIILTLVGGLLSIGISLIIMNGLKELLLNTNPLRDVVGAFKLNWRILSLSFISAIVFGLISGVLPAFRMSKLNVVNAIKGTIK